MAEQSALGRSARAYLAMALLGGVFALLAGSEAILLDGIYSLISFAMTLLAGRVARLVEIPLTPEFHFGFAHFEPLLNTLRILLILVIAAFALVSAVTALLEGGRPLSAGSALVYGLLAAVGCLFMAALQQRAARRAASPLLAVDARNWLVDGALSSGVALTFLGAYLLQETGYAHWIPYVDPLLVVAMILLLVPVPLRILRDNLGQVLMAAPDAGLQQRARSRIEPLVAHLDPLEIVIRMLPVGRFLYLQIHLVLPPGTRLGDVSELDHLRRRIRDAMKDLHARPTLDFSFTADRAWAYEGAGGGGSAPDGQSLTSSGWSSP